jgi:parvulin-like peptidyl-prolyl isomerase
MKRLTWKFKGLAACWAVACMLNRAPAQDPVPVPMPASPVVPTAATTPAVKPAAVVNGDTIPMSDVEAVLKQAGPTAVPMNEEQRRGAQHQALAMLIDETLIHQFLKEHGPVVTDADVNRKLEELDAGWRKENKSLAEFARERGLSEAQVRTEVTYALRWHAYVRQQISDAMVEKYYAENKDFFDGVLVSASHIVLRIQPGAPAADQQAARQKLADVRAQIAANKLEFADAAKKFSQCPSAQNGGDIGQFPRKWVVDEAFAKAAFAMKVGDVSDVVQSEYGLHLIKVTNRTPGQPSDFAKIKESVRELCAEEARQTLLVRIRKDAKIVVNIP